MTKASEAARPPIMSRAGRRKARYAADPVMAAARAVREKEYRKARNKARENRRKVRLAADPVARKAHNKRKKQAYKARLKTDPVMRKAFNKRKKTRARAADPPAWKAKKQAENQRARTRVRAARYFVGCDGEGIREADGRCSYALFRMGDRELYTGKRLTTPELLQFIVAHPAPAAILVGFFFEYDISNIVRDVPCVRDAAQIDTPSRLEYLLQVDMKAVDSVDKKSAHPNPHRFGGWTSLKFEGYPLFGVRYIPKNYLSVCLLAWLPKTVKGETRFAYRAIKGTTRTIYDTQGFFQTTFLKALKLWGIGAEHWEKIAEMKDRRSAFTGMTADERAYCAIECDLLAQMMDAFRAQCVETDMEPATWNGAGKIASALLKRHNAIRHAELLDFTPAPVIDLAHAAYYGGRFETPWIGRLRYHVWEHDINSAYPAAMLDLPCLKHGRWIEEKGGPRTPAFAGAGSDSDLFIARGRFSHPPGQFLCGLPMRSKQGRLSWPREGNGVYWSPEIRSAERLGATFHPVGGWRFEPGCDCDGHAFVADLYAKRLAIDAASGGVKSRGIPIKLGLNSLYGKKAQRIGNPTFANPLEAGLITAITRARLNDAIVAAGDPRRVVMVATDAVYTLDDPIDALPCGPELGQWGRKRFDAGMFIVRPGLYWPLGPRGDPADAGKLRTRGISPRFFEPLIPAFERTWDEWITCWDQLWPSSVNVPITAFIGVRLAMRRGDPALSCQWIDTDRDVTFTWSDKRGASRKVHDALILEALAGGPDLHSHHYDRDQVLASSSVFEIDRMLVEALPDYLDLGPPVDD